MAAGVQHNAHVLARRYALRAQRLDKALHDELAVQAQMAARVMRRRVAVGVTGLAQASVHVEDRGPAGMWVGPGAAHARFIEDGVKPGGKGLPRFDDPAGADIVRWLQTKAFPGAGRGSKAFRKIEQILRDRYQGLAWHIRRFGVKAQPFVEPTAREIAQPMAAALRATVMNTLRAGDAGALQ